MSDDPASRAAFRWERRRSQIEALRVRWEAMGEMANSERYAAAQTIENLMDEVEGWKAATQKAERDVLELRERLDVEENAVNHLHTDRNNLRLELDRIRQKGTA